jgi:hypothetical protein
MIALSNLHFLAEAGAKILILSFYARIHSIFPAIGYQSDCQAPKDFLTLSHNYRGNQSSRGSHHNHIGSALGSAMPTTTLN